MIHLKLEHSIFFLSLLFIFFCSSEKGTKNKSLPQSVDTNKKEVPQFADDNGEIKDMKGTIIYQKIEGGFYGIVGDDGGKYNPINLDKKYKKDGLRVEFDAKVKKDMMGIHMWGQYVQILKIEELPPEK